MEEVPQSSPAPAEQDTSPPESIEDSPVMNNIKAAMEWMKANSHLFSGKVLYPKVLDMEREAVLLALATYDMLKDTCTDPEEIWKPFVFTFETRDDMEVFMTEVRDKGNIHVSAVINLES